MSQEERRVVKRGEKRGLYSEMLKEMQGTLKREKREEGQVAKVYMSR